MRGGFLRFTHVSIITSNEGVITKMTNLTSQLVSN